MNNLEALMLPNCLPRRGQDAYSFPCGLELDFRDASMQADLYGAPGDPLGIQRPPMATVAHRRHHEEQHDEMDQWTIVEVEDPDGKLCELWCECIKRDTHWHFLPQLLRPHGGRDGA